MPRFLRDYVNTPLPAPYQLWRRFGLAFILFLYTWLIGMLILSQTSPSVPWLMKGWSAATILWPYSFSFFLLSEAWGRFQERTVLHTWTLSLLSFIFSYFVLYRGYALVSTVYPETEWREFLSLGPIWFGATIFVIQPKILRQNSINLHLIHDANLWLEHHPIPNRVHQYQLQFSGSSARLLPPVVEETPTETIVLNPPTLPPPQAPLEEKQSKQVTVSDGGEVYILNVLDITHVSVEEHYCQIFLNPEKEQSPIQARVPLKELMKQLPQDLFIQIHRSHVANALFASKVNKQPGTHQLSLCDNQFNLPISRRKVSIVLLFLKEFALQNREL